jgi:hypothetical protein
MMPRDTITTPLALVGVFALLGALFCVSAYYGAAESKRLNRVNQENIAWQK